MLEADTPEAADYAAMHQKKRRLLFAIFGNVVLLVVMVGGPFARGYFRTRALWREFGRFGACLTGGQPSAEAGMGSPVGADAYFAARVLEAQPDWPERCQKLLQAGTPDEPIFLLPNLKRAESDIRAAAKLLHTELSGLAVRVPGERLSNRPLRALEHLRAAITRHSQAAGVLEVPDGDAFVLARAKGLPTPARLPLFASSDARIDVWGDDRELSALSVDLTGLSWLRVWAGGLNQKRLARPKLLDAYLPSAEGGLWVWAMPRVRCREREGGCAHKTMGVAELSLPLLDAPTPRWLGAHPVGRAERSLLRQGERLLVLAEADESKRRVREFQLPHPLAAAEEPAAQGTPPLSATDSWPVSARGEAVLTRLAGEPLVLFAEAGSDGTRLWLGQKERAEPRQLAAISGGEQPWLVSAPCGQGMALAFGHRSALALAVLNGDGTLQAFAEQPIALESVVDDRDPAHDRVRAFCVGPGRALAVARDSAEQLVSIACERGAPGCRNHQLASGVFSFSALTVGEQVLVAFAGRQNRAQLRVLALDERGAVKMAERVPAACWAPSGGMCGAALLAQLGKRVLLGAREGTDLLMLESLDLGRTWRPLSELKRAP